MKLYLSIPAHAGAVTKMQFDGDRKRWTAQCFDCHSHKVFGQQDIANSWLHIHKCRAGENRKVT